MHNNKEKDLKDFLLLSSQFDNQPFDWKHLNRNSLNSLLQMCIHLKIPVNFHHIQKKDVIEIINRSAKFPGSQTNLGFPPDYFEHHLAKFNYPTIIYSPTPPPNSPAQDNSSDDSEQINSQKTDSSLTKSVRQNDLNLIQKFIHDTNKIPGTLKSHLNRWRISKIVHLKKWGRNKFEQLKQIDKSKIPLPSSENVILFYFLILLIAFIKYIICYDGTP